MGTNAFHFFVNGISVIKSHAVTVLKVAIERIGRKISTTAIHFSVNHLSVNLTPRVQTSARDRSSQSRLSNWDRFPRLIEPIHECWQ